jgi:peptidoglycan/LPS O-acetylase OafA/YrhL
MVQHLDTPFVTHLGRAGVDVFFVISGFIMFHTTRDRSRTVGGFWRDRILRIVPLYWLATGAILILVLMGLHPLGINGVDSQDVLADALFIPDVRVDGDIYPIVDVGWTLNYEMYFYLIFGLTFFLPSQGWALAALTAFFLAAWWLVTAVSGLPHAVHQWGQPIALEFAGGGALALLYRAPIRFPRWLEGTAGALAVVAGVYALVKDAGGVGWMANEDFAARAFWFGIPAAAIVGGALLLERAGYSLRNRFLLLLGAASYAIYLVHHLIVQVAADVAERFLPHPSLPIALFEGALIFALAAGAGIAVHTWVEGPLTRWLKRGGRRAAPEAADSTPT